MTPFLGVPFLSLGAGPGLLAADEGLADGGFGEMVLGTGQQVAVEDDEVGELAGLERALLVLFKGQPGVVGHQKRGHSGFCSVPFCEKVE